MILLSLFLLISLVVNGILVWYIRDYTRNVDKQYSYAIRNIDEYQKLLDQYQYTLKALYELEDFYGDQEIKIAIEHTKIVADACAGFKSTLLKTDDNNDNSENTKQEEESQ